MSVPAGGSVSVKLVLRTSKLKVDGTAPVFVRVTANRKSRFVATGVYVEPKYWNPMKQEVRKSHDIADTHNETLRAKRVAAMQAALDAPSAQAVKAKLDGNGKSMTAYFERFVKGLEASGQYWEEKKYRVTLGKLRGALGQELAWREVDRNALVRLERYIRIKKKDNPNTVRKELTRLRRVFKQAIRDGEFRPADDPFLVYEKPKGQRVNRRKLSLEEVVNLGALVEDDGLIPGSFEEQVRDAFTFAFYAGGMRFGDICCLRASAIKDGRVEYRMLKTKTPMSVPVPAPAIEIARRYAVSANERDGFLFPFLEKGDDEEAVGLRRKISSWNARANAALKEIAKMAGMEAEGLSTHVARHSFADYARRMSGDLYAISKALGHGNLQTTEAYLESFDREAVDNLAQAIWG